jgi:hypothetical protein
MGRMKALILCHWIVWIWTLGFMLGTLRSTAGEDWKDNSGIGKRNKTTWISLPLSQSWAEISYEQEQSAVSIADFSFC